ncbi:hypothetical protein [Hydrocarboniphaga sp.]|uniref:hypothetical protein n=1 Tax=Hydrocarboniphaga sp. TaxID=2033016 RepID=UPI0026151A94|nr:hypothetical protein [Hydrocarboniphaga sp.]
MDGKMKRSTVVLIVVALTYILGGLVEPFVPNPGQPFNEATLVQNLLSAILGFTWCKLHTSERGIEAPAGSALFVGLFAPLGVPLYFFRSMPWKKAATSTLKAVGFLVLILVLFGVGAEISSAIAVQLSVPPVSASAASPLQPSRG